MVQLPCMHCKLIGKEYIVEDMIEYYLHTQKEHPEVIEIAMEG